MMRAMAFGIAGRDTKPGHASGHHVLRELHLLGLVIFGGADIGAGNVAEFLGGGLAALFDRRAEGVVQHLENERKLAFCSAACAAVMPMARQAIDRVDSQFRLATLGFLRYVGR